MSKDKNINIHVKTPGARQAKEQLDGVGRSAHKTGDSVENATAKSKRGSRGFIGNLAGMAVAFTAVAVAAVGAARKVITAIDEMVKASDAAVKALASQQKAAADYFEAMDAYTPKSRKDALAQARTFQQKTGLGFDESKLLLESYKRTFKYIDKPAAEQLAGYWQLHGGGSTPAVVRWLGASDVTDSSRQGQILRMISQTATQTGLRDEEVIQGLTQYSTEFRQFGWGPEETIENVGKVMSGLSGREARRAVSGLVEGLKTFTEEKAIEAGLPKDKAALPQKRIDWVSEHMQSLPLQDRNKFMQDAFGKTYATYVTKWMTGEVSPEARRAMDYVRTEAAAEEERQRVLGVRSTAESVLAQAEGISGKLGYDVEQRKNYDAAIRQVGQGYLEYLKRKHPARYHWVKIKAVGSEEEKRIAAYQLWVDSLSEEEKQPLRRPGVADYVPFWEEWGSYGGPEKIEQLGRASDRILEGGNSQEPPVINNHYHNDIIYNPRTGDPEAGQRFSQD